MRLSGRPLAAAYLGLLLAGALLVGACGATAGAQSPTTGQTTTVRRGTVEATINASGTAKAVADLNLSLEGSTTIKEVLVKVGDRVRAGQPLIRAETRDLELALQQAEANLASAQAQYAQTKAGATEKEIAQAESAVISAQAQHQLKIQGTTTPQDLTNAQAAVRSAEARLAATIAGTTTPQDLASAEAALRLAEANLAEVRARPDPTTLDTAVQQLNQARDNRAKQASQLALAKEQARIAIEAATNDLQTAQARYGAAKLIWDEAQRTNKDPNIPVQKNPTNRDYRDLSDAKRRQYKSDFEAAERSMVNAEQTLEQRKLAYEAAKQQEITDLRTAASQVLTAEANLRTVMAGATAVELAQAEASVEQARASLDKLRQPPKEADIIQAQAAVDQARANLEKLRAPAKATDVAQAQAAVEQARASLEKLQKPADPNDLAQSKASLASAQVALDEVKAGPKAAALATALASVKQAESSLAQARSAVSKATLTAPFPGVVATVNAIPGQSSTASSGSSTASTTSGLVTLVDDSTLSIDVNVAEADIAKVTVGQPARATFAALAGQAIPGKVTAVAPKATVLSNVVSYVTTVALEGEARTAVKTGMTATVSIITTSKANVLVVPNRVVQSQGQQRFVTVEYKGERVSAPVQIGLVGDSTSEVVAGLAEGDVVVTSAQTGGQGGAQTKPGVQVKPGGGFGGPVFKP